MDCSLPRYIVLSGWWLRFSFFFSIGACIRAQRLSLGRCDLGVSSSGRSVMAMSEGREHPTGEKRGLGFWDLEHGVDAVREILHFNLRDCSF
jgi:hypothetical protein